MVNFAFKSKLKYDEDVKRHKIINKNAKCREQDLTFNLIQNESE